MSTSPSVPPHVLLEAELRALRAEVAALRALNRDDRALARDAARYHSSQVRFRTVFEHSPLGHKIIGPDLLIRQANPAVAALLGLSGPADLVGRSIRAFAYPGHHDDWTALQAALWDRSLPSFALETRLRRADGAEVWCRVTSVLIPDEDGPLGYTTLEDITDRRHLEARLAETAAQQAAANAELTALNEHLRVANATVAHVNAELDTFVYAAAHDLRAPLANLQGLVRLLGRPLPAPVPGAPPGPPLAGLMQTSVDRLRRSLDRLADFGAARQQLAQPREPLSLAVALEEVRAEVAPLLLATGGRLEAALADDPHAWFSAPHLHSVLLNLVSNALKYAHPGRPPVVRVRAYRDAARVVVSVQDNGRGMTEAQLGQLFGLFQRFHPDVAGTGIGLYLVLKILTHAGGTVGVESQPGGGTTFTLVLPA